MTFVARRALHALALALGVSLLSFSMLELAPGDFTDELRLDPRVSEETLDAMRERFGLERSFAERYVTWLAKAVRGDLGHSYAYDAPVASLLWTRGSRTLLLGTTALAAAWLVAVPLGIAWARRRGGWLDRSLSVGTTVLLSLPELVLGLALLVLAVRVEWLPVGGMTSLDHDELSLWGRAWDVARHMLLPAAALAAGALPVLVRHVRTSVSEVLGSPCVAAARAHGIPAGRILYGHALPAAAQPLVTLFGLSLAGLLSGSVLVEVVMGWPGLGPLLLEAIRGRDVHLVIGSVMTSTLLLVGGNLLADLLLYAVDPRIRRQRRA